MKALEIDGMISGGGAYIEFGDRQVQENFFPMRVLADVLEVIRKRKLGAALRGQRRDLHECKGCPVLQRRF